MERALTIILGDLDDPRVRTLVEEHIASAHAATARGSAHALDADALKAPDIEFWAVWGEGTLLGVGALKRLSSEHGEIKSMHTALGHRRKGTGSAMLRHIIDAARAMGIARLSLETGSGDYFMPAREFYKKHGFAECSPFGEYVCDPSSVFMCRELR